MSSAAQIKIKTQMKIKYLLVYFRRRNMKSCLLLKPHPRTSLSGLWDPAWRKATTPWSTRA